MHPYMTYGAGFGRLMACLVIVVLWCRALIIHKEPVRFGMEEGAPIMELF